LTSCSINDERSVNRKFKDSFKSGFMIGYVFWMTSTIVVFTSYCVPWMYVGKRNNKITVAEMLSSMIPKKQRRAEERQECRNPTAELLLGKTEQVLSPSQSVHVYSVFVCV